MLVTPLSHSVVLDLGSGVGGGEEGGLQYKARLKLVFLIDRLGVGMVKYFLLVLRLLVYLLLLLLLRIPRFIFILIGLGSKTMKLEHKKLNFMFV